MAVQDRRDGTDSEETADWPVTGKPAGQLEFSITRLGPDPGPGPGPQSPRGRRPLLRYRLATLMAVAALAGTGTVLLSRPAGHAPPSAAPRSPVRAAADGRATPADGRAAAGRPAPSQGGTASVPQPGHRVTPPVATTAVAGIGCPDGLGQDVTVTAATAGPQWLPAPGGWTGNGCNGDSAWTLGTPVSALVPTLTWFFHPGQGTSLCTLAVYVPTLNAVGAADYAIANGNGVLSTVRVNQAAAAGRWARLGRYRVAGLMMSIQFTPLAATLPTVGPAALTPAGLPAPVTAGGPVAVSAARATCS
jgi:hypothetical protein